MWTCVLLFSRRFPERLSPSPESIVPTPAVFPSATTTTAPALAAASKVARKERKGKGQGKGKGKGKGKGTRGSSTLQQVAIPRLWSLLKHGCYNGGAAGYSGVLPFISGITLSSVRRATKENDAGTFFASLFAKLLQGAGDSGARGSGFACALQAGCDIAAMLLSDEWRAKQILADAREREGVQQRRAAAAATTEIEKELQDGGGASVGSAAGSDVDIDAQLDVITSTACAFIQKIIADVLGAESTLHSAATVRIAACALSSARAFELSHAASSSAAAPSEVRTPWSLMLERASVTVQGSHDAGLIDRLRTCSELTIKHAMPLQQFSIGFYSLI